MGVQEVRWEKEGTLRAGHFFYGKGNESHPFGAGFFVHHRKLLSVNGVEFVSDRMSHRFLRGRWCNIIVLIAHASIEENSGDSKDSFMGN